MNELNEYGKRITAAALALDIPVSDLSHKLSGMGILGDHVDVLDDEELFRFGDFREAFKDKGIVLIRKAYRELKGGKKPAEHEAPGDPATDERTALMRQLGFKVRVDDAPTERLLPYYLPDKPNDPITVALKKRFGDKPVIAFTDEGTVALEESLQYLADLEQGLPPVENITVAGRLARLWPIGVKPDVMVDEDPLFPGVPLRRGYSSVNHRNWNGIPLEKRQLCRIIVTRGDIDPNNKEAVLRLLERAATANGLSEAYPEAEMAFREQQKRGILLPLKIALGTQPAKVNNPFGIRRQY